MQPQTDLKITCIESEERGERALLFTPRGGQEVLVPLTKRVEEAIGDLRRTLPDQLKVFHTCVSDLAGLTQDDIWKNIDKGVRELEEIASEFILNLTITPEKQQELTQAFRLAIPTPLNGRERPSRIELVMDTDDIDLLSLPVEIFSPLLRDDVAGDYQIDSLSLLTQALVNFPGFPAVVTRRLHREFDARQVVERSAEGRVPVKAIRYKAFYHGMPTLEAISEVRWLKQNDHTFDVDEWPDEEVDERRASELLGRCLFDPRVGFTITSTERDFVDQIQHFSCHYHRGENGREHFELRKAFGMVQKLEISTSAIINRLVGLGDPRSRPAGRPGPLIFVNACGSGAVNPKGRLSLVETFLLRTLARAIVVTETPVHFPMAARFATAVYTEIIAGEALGSALHRARWALVEAEKSPFGILYTLYGSPDLKLEGFAVVDATGDEGLS